MAKILVVHKNDTIAELFCEVFEKEGIQVDRASSYFDGLEQTKKSDYNISFVQGSEIWLHGDEIVRVSKWPVIMISGGNSESFRTLSIQTGCQGFIAMPPQDGMYSLVKLVKKNLN